MSSNKQSQGQGWILLTHSHNDLTDIDEAAILDALPDDMRNGAREPVRIRGTGQVRNRSRIDWPALQREQAEQIEHYLQPVIGSRSIAYFGRSLIPLALDLGYRVQPWAPKRVFLYHHTRASWAWSETAANAAPINVYTDIDLPAKPALAAGPVVIRVSVTTRRIAPEDTRVHVPQPLVQADIHLGDSYAVEALRTPEELEQVAMAFRKVLYQIHELYPNAGPIHLFAAVPAGLAFLMGTHINRNVHPIVHTYEFEQTATPRYQPALIIGEETQAPMKLKIQFLSAEPDTTRRLHVDRELRTISEQLRNGDRRELFETAEPQLAVRVADIQAHIRRARAQIVHFSGHGEEGGYLLIENAAGHTQRLAPESLRMLFELWNDDRHLRCAVFNACHTHTLADALVQAPAVLDCAIGTFDNIPDTPAIQFSLGFYSALADGATLEKAFKAGQVQIGIQYPQYVDLFHLAVAEPAIRHKPLSQR